MSICQGLLLGCSGAADPGHGSVRGCAGLRGLLECDALRSNVYAYFGLASTILVFQAMEAEVLSEIHNRKVAFEHADVEARGHLAMTSSVTCPCGRYFVFCT